MDDIFPSGVAEWTVHVHLPSQDRSRHGVVDFLVRDPLPKVAVSGAIRVGATATWPGTVCPAGVMAVQDSVECHEKAIEDHNIVATRVKMVQLTLTCVRR